MTTPNLIANRRYSAATRLRLQILFARAWEALADTYQVKAVEFVHRLRTRLGVDEALDRYFREVGVPAAMVDTVRARALIALAPLVERLGDQEPQGIAWTPLRPDHLLGALRRRAQYVEDTNLECRLAASLSAEAVSATHVRMAVETADLMAVECPPDEAIMHYIRTFHLPAIDAQLILRRAMAQWAGRDPLGLDQVEPESPAFNLVPRTPQIDLGSRLRIGLRAIS